MRWAYVGRNGCMSFNCSTIGSSDSRMEFMSAMADMEVAPDARKGISRFPQLVRNVDRKRAKVV